MRDGFDIMAYIIYQWGDIFSWLISAAHPTCTYSQS